MKKLMIESGIMENDGSFRRGEVTADTIGFQIAPRINAAGRIDHANTAFHLFMTDRATDAVDLAFALDQTNIERREITKDLFEQAIKQVEKQTDDSPIVFVLGTGWSTGLVGLIAGRLKEKYHKPSIVMALNDGEITGSGRSIEGFNIIECFQEMPEVFSKYGGHPMACGFTLESPDRLEEFKEKLRSKFFEKTKDINISPVLHIDAEIELSDVTWDLYDILDKFRPFGMANPKPTYLIRNAEVFNIASMGSEQNHMRLSLRDSNGRILKAVGWGLCGSDSDTNWCALLTPGDRVDIVCDISVNEWNGNRELQLMITDLKKSE